MRSRTHTNMKQGTPAARKNRTAMSAVDSLRTHEKMAALMPTLTRMVAIQKDCSTILPDMFGNCAVVRLDSDQLVLSAPNAAMAARLKQKLPILQEALHQAGWQISAIRLKVQPVKNLVESIRSEKQGLPQQAISAFAALEQSIEKTPRNEALKAAIGALVQRHR